MPESGRVPREDPTPPKEAPDAGWRRAGFRTPAGRAAFDAWYDTVRAASRVDWALETVPTPWGPTRVAVAGPANGRPLVFLHGWSGNGMIWEITGGLHRLLDRYRLYLVDVIGQPTGSSARTPHPAGPGYGQWLDGVCARLGIASAGWVGMSFGGFLIARLALEAPGRVARAALLAPAGFVPLRRSPGLFGAFLRTWARPDDAAVRRFVHGQLLGSEHGFLPAEAERLEALFGVTFRHFRAGARPPFPLPDAELAALDAPVLLLCGAEDALFDPQRTVARARRVLPRLVEAVVLPGQGHALGRTAGVADRLGAFFDAGGADGGA